MSKVEMILMLKITCGLLVVLAFVVLYLLAKTLNDIQKANENYDRYIDSL